MASFAGSVAAVSSDPEVRGSQGITRSWWARVGLVTLVAAVVANVVFYYVGKLFVDYNKDFLILADVQATISVTAMAAAIAVVVYAVLSKTVSNPQRTFTRVSAVVLALSFVPTLTLVPGEEGSSTGQITILILMHLLATAVIVPLLTRSTRGRNA